MGDVSLTTPVLKGFSEQYPGNIIILVTRKAFSPFFNIAGNLQLFFPDFTTRHKGLAGLLRLYRDILKEGNVDYVIDLHDVIRTRILRFLFHAGGVPVKVIDKGRREKRLMIKGKNTGQLKHSVERYADVFEKAGFKINLLQGPWIIPSGEKAGNVLSKTGFRAGLNIGVAPFARHKLKEWREDYMADLLKMLNERDGARIWLFGGKDEIERLEFFRKKIPGSIVPSVNLNLEEEIALIASLSFMISMDSSNMHMAALVGTRVISIWGGTDRMAGFGAWMQPEEYSVSIPVSRLTCRPCTVYGKGECRRGDHACMEWLMPEMVYQRIADLGLLKTEI